MKYLSVTEENTLSILAAMLAELLSVESLSTRHNVTFASAKPSFDLTCTAVYNCYFQQEIP